jgi:hypothetical protein
VRFGAGANLSPETELEFFKSLWGLGTEEEEGYRTGPPGYIGWRNSFLGINSGAPYTFKNTGSGFLHSISCVIKTSFCHIPYIEQSKIYVFITVVKIILQFSIVFLRNVNLYTASLVYWCQ